MRKSLFTGFTILFLVFGLFLSETFAASISGTISYSGSQTGSIVVAVFDSPLSCSPVNPPEDPINISELDTIGDYSISNLSDGTYYLAAAILTGGIDGDIQATDPWAIYNGCDNVTPVEISGGADATGMNMVLVDGTEEEPNPFYSPYYIHGHSAHDASGYWMEITVDDASHILTAVSITGPGIDGTYYLEYNSSEGRWDSSSTGKVAYSVSPLSSPPFTYNVAITDGSGTTDHEVIIYDYVEVFATDLAPGGGQTITENPVFSWTGVDGNYTYELHLDSINWYKYNLTETSIVYDGEPLTPGTTYEWHVNVADQYGNIAYSFASFIYQPNKPNIISSIQLLLLH